MMPSDSVRAEEARRRRAALRRDLLALLAGLAIGAGALFALEPAHAGACRASARCGMVARS